MGEKKRRLASGAPAPQVAAGASTDALLVQARRLLDQGKATEAFAHAQRALTAAPRQPEALHLLGRCCLAVGQADTGIGLLRAAVAAQPQSIEYRSTLGRGLAQAGRLRDAVEHLQFAATGSADADICRDLGAVLVRLDRAREAEAAYERAAELAPQRPDTHEALARLRYQRDAMAAARRSFDRALALDPALIERLNIGSARRDASSPDDGVVRARADAVLEAASAAWLAVRWGPSAAGGTLHTTDNAHVQAACEARSMIIFDDFLADAHDYRRRALQLAYPHSSTQAGINYPGLQTAAQPCDAIMQRIATALGRDIKWDSPDNGAFRISPANANARNDIHVDSDVRNEIFAAVLYLSLPEHCRGGTVFWRHRATGWERRPGPEQLAANGYATFKQFERRWMPVDRQRPFSELQQHRDATWECVLEVPMRFNRLIVYRSDYFHSIGDLFGDRPENSRFVQLFFFEAAQASS